MSTRPPIIQNFDSLRLALETEAFSMIRPADWGEDLINIEAKISGSIKTEIIKHRSRNREFYKLYGYDWMVKPDNYQNGLEAMYQLWAIRMLADSPRNNSSRSRFCNIAVRLLPSAVASAESILNNGFRYIVISTAFLGLIKSYVWLQYSLFKIGKRHPSVENIIVTDILGGVEIESALRSRDPEVLGVVEKFVNIVIDYVRFRAPSLPPAKLYDLINDSNSGFHKFGLIITAVEAFLIYHELAHLLEHDFSQEGRSTKEELDADFVALSMLINHSATNKTGMLSYFLGPISGIQLFRLVEMVRRTIEHLEPSGKIAIAPEENAAYKRNALKNEEELSTRLHGLKVSMARYGMLQLAGPLFDDIATETHLPIVACQGYMLGQLGDSSPFDHYTTLLKQMGK
ncbi:hypothetical protein G2912_19780 [Paraburkholderia aspalathi]|nr:hypothetical protein [Paraburkholderia aspalathi]MBK3812599.1 hypothetical protein [Paraburkholderia aspalathi]